MICSGNIKGEKPYKQGASCAECGEGYINEDNLCGKSYSIL